MPLWIFILILALMTAANIVADAAVLHFLARVCRATKLTLQRAVIVPLAMFPLAAVSIVVPDEMLSGGAALGLAVAMLLLVVCGVKYLGRTSFGRAIIITLLFILVMVPLNSGVAMVLKFTFVEAFHVQSDGMAPSLRSGDRVVVDRTCTPRRWDIAVFRLPEKPTDIVVQRVVGLPGETIEIIGGEIHINGEVVPRPPALADIRYIGDRPYRGTCHGCAGSPMRLGAAEYFVLGDNSANSWDSRYWGRPAQGVSQSGALPGASIIATIRFIYSPIHHARMLR